jgi:hypothetical protein
MKGSVMDLICSEHKLRRRVAIGLAGFLLVALYVWMPVREVLAQQSCMTTWANTPSLSGGTLRFTGRFLSGCQLSSTNLTVRAQRYRNYGWENLGSTSTTRSGTFDTTLTYNHSCYAGPWSYRTAVLVSGFATKYSTSRMYSC